MAVPAVHRVVKRPRLVISVVVRVECAGGNILIVEFLYENVCMFTAVQQAYSGKSLMFVLILLWTDYINSFMD